MKSIIRLSGVFLILAVIAVALWPAGQENAGLPVRGPAGSSLPVANEAGQQAQGPFVSEAVTPGLSPAVRDLPPPQLDEQLDREVNPRLNLNPPQNLLPLNPDWQDPLAVLGLNPDDETPPILFDFAGMSRSLAGTGTPPDTIGDVGLNHYVQMVNVLFSIYDKSGNLLDGPHAVNQLWDGQGGACEAQNAGDPVVLYDWLADRWLISQFSFSNDICVAVSATADPTGSYHTYEFSFSQFPDYFKMGVWPDAYYIGANQSGNNVHALDRDAMLNGQAAAKISFSQPSVSLHSMLLPSDLDGYNPPPAGSPNYFHRFIDGDLFGGQDRIELFEFHVDFDTPGSSTWTGPAALPSAAFASLCNFSFDCIRQPDTGQRLDSVTEWPMWRFQYRNFGSHETLVSNHAVNMGGDQAGVRWFELRKVGSGDWSIYQEGTHAPDSHSRWMASVALDGDGNMALGYSASSTSLYPSIRYATRSVTDTLGTLRPEVTLIAGGGSQTALNRWGDYSSLNVDPADDCTFWYTNEYYSATATNNWKTRIGVFKIPSCGTAAGDPDINVPGSVSSTQEPDTVVTRTLAINNNGTATLSWSISEAENDCGSPSDLTWVSANPTAGTIPASGSSDVAVIFDAAGLAAESYTGLLCISSNDPDTPLVEVDLALHVEAADSYTVYLPLVFTVSGSP